MVPTVRLRDGIHIESDRTVVCDARRATGDVAVVSHAHADHARRNAKAVVCSALTAALIETRTGVAVERVDPPADISLRPAGHVPGSSAVVIDEGQCRVLYTGDVSTRDRGPRRGFEPVAADVLIVEATYGRPSYRFPPQAQEEARLRDFIADTADPLVLYGYSLGRAQTLERIAREATARRLVVHPTVAAVNAAIEAHTDRSFDAVSWADLDRLAAADVVVAPAGARRGEWFADQLARLEPVSVGASGWAVDESYRYRAGVDEAFVLTDHCDFDELCDLVEAVDPERVYTHHGFAVDFAAHLTAELGYEAVALRRGQRRLEEFAEVSSGSGV